MGESGLVCDAKDDRLELETVGRTACLRLGRRGLSRLEPPLGCRMEAEWEMAVGAGRTLPLSAWEMARMWTVVKAVKVEVKTLV